MKPLASKLMLRGPLKGTFARAAEEKHQLPEIATERLKTINAVRIWPLQTEFAYIAK